MPYTLDETFAAGIPPGFAASVAGVTVVHDAASEAVDLSFPATQSYWRIDAVPAESDFWFEFDAELVSRWFSAWHFGFWLPGTVGSGGYRYSVIGDPSSTWSGATWGSAGGGQDSNQRASDAVETGLAPGMRRTFRIDARVFPGQNATLIRVSADGQERCRFYYPGDTLFGPTLLPGIFGYGMTMRVHSVKGGSGSVWSDMPSEFGARGLPNALLALGRYQPPARPVHRALARLVSRHHSVFSGPGKIAGTVKEKGTPNAPVARKVVLLDQATHAVVADTFSDPLTGAYEFEQLSMLRKYVALSYDHEGDFRAVIADSLVPTP